MEISYTVEAKNSGTTLIKCYCSPHGKCLHCVHRELLKNPEFKEEYLKPNMLRGELKMLRIQKGLTQKELAKLVGTTQSGIARAENHDGYLKLDLIHRMARALGHRVKVEFELTN